MVRYCTFNDNLVIGSTSASSGTASNGVIRDEQNYWTPANSVANQANQRLTFSFSGGPQYVTGVTTRGQINSNNYVRSFELEFGLDPLSSEHGQSTSSSGSYLYKNLRSNTIGYRFSGNQNSNSLNYVKLPYPILARSITFKPLSWNGRIALAAAVHGYSPAGGVTGSLLPRPGGVCSENGGGNELTQGEYGGPGTALAVDIYGAKLLSDNMGLGPRLPLVYREPGGPCDKYNLEMSGAVGWVFDDPMSVDFQPSWSNSTMISTLKSIDEIKFSVGAQVAFKPSSLASGSSGGSASSITLQVTRMLGDDSTAAHFLNEINYILKENNVITASTFFQSTSDSPGSFQLFSGLNKVEKTLNIEGLILTQTTSQLEYGKRSGSKMTVYNIKAASEVTPLQLNRFIIHSSATVELMPKHIIYNATNDADAIFPKFSGPICGGKPFELTGNNTYLELGSSSWFRSPCRCAFADRANIVLSGTFDCGLFNYLPSAGALRELHVNSNGRLRLFSSSELNRLQTYDEIDVAGSIEIMTKPPGGDWGPTDLFKLCSNEFYIRKGGSVVWRENNEKRLMTVESQKLISIDGILSPGGTQTVTTFAEAPPLESFTVGRYGNAILTISGDLLAEDITVSGRLHFRNNVTFGGKYTPRSRSFVVTGPYGSLRTEIDRSLPSAETTFINADEVVVGGELITGRLDRGEDGWMSLETHSGSKFDFHSREACSAGAELYMFYVSKVSINGSMNIHGFIEFRPHPKWSTERMDFFIVGSSGVVIINEPSNSSECGVKFSRIKAVDVTVAGDLLPSTLDISPGWDRLTVVRGGTFVMTPASEYRIDKVAVNGKWHSLTALLLRGFVRLLTANIDIGSYGEFSVDHNRASLTADQWVSESTINAHQVAVNGRFHGGLLSTDVLQKDEQTNSNLTSSGQEINQNGWDSLHIGQGGHVQFRISQEAMETFLVDVINCNGSLFVYDTVKVLGKRNEMLEDIYIGPEGSIILHSLPGETSNASHVYSNRVFVDGGEFISTDIELFTSWGWEELLVERGGTAHILLKETEDLVRGLFPVNFLTISGTNSLVSGCDVFAVLILCTIKISKGLCRTESRSYKQQNKQKVAKTMTLHCGSFIHFPQVQFVNHVTIKGRNRTVTDSVNVMSGGTLLLPRDTSQQCLASGACERSRIHSDYVTVSGGTLDTGYLSIGRGWKNLRVESAAMVTVMSSPQTNQAFPIDNITVTGTKKRLKLPKSIALFP